MSTENLRNHAGMTSPIARRAASVTAARLSLAAGAATLVLLAALHFLSPELDPSWHMVSEYASGDYGWVLALLFIAWSLCAAALFLAVKPHIRTLGGKIGLGFLLLSALGMALAAVFDFHHPLHGLAALLGIPTFPVAALLVSRGLLHNPAWFAVSARRALLWTANLTWISLALMLATVLIGLLQTGGQFGPSVPVGWPNRLLVIAYCAWMLVVARRVAQLDRR